MTTIVSYLPEKPYVSPESTSTLCGDGAILESFGMSECPVGNDDTMSEASKPTLGSLPHQRKLRPAAAPLPKSEKTLSTPESPLPDNEMTSNDKSPPYEAGIPSIASFETWLRDSTSSVPDSCVSWPPCATGVSAKLWLPTKIACADLRSISLSGKSSVLEATSWYVANGPNETMKRSFAKTCAPWSPSSVPDSMDSGGTKQRKRLPSAPTPTTSRQPTKRQRLRDGTAKPTYSVCRKPKPKHQNDDDMVMRSRRIRLCPTPKQRKLLKEWMHTARATYNAALGAVNKESVPVNFIKLRNHLVPKKSQYAVANPWTLDTPKSVRAESIRDLVTAFNSNYAKQRLNPSHSWKMRFRSRKRNKGLVALNIEAPNFKVSKDGKIKLFPNLGFGELAYRVGRRKRLPPIEHTCKLTYTEPGIWHLHIPVSVRRDNDRRRRGKVASCDPGVRTFQTCYTTEGAVADLGIGPAFQTKVVDRLHRIDRLASLATKSNHVRRQRLRRKQAALRYKIIARRWAWINEIHWKTARWLCSQHSAVLLGKLNVKALSSKNKRTMGRSNVRKLYAWSHYKFQQRMLCKVFPKGENWGAIAPQPPVVL